jgi:hypothetical protein
MSFEEWSAAHLAKKPGTPQSQLRGGYNAYRGTTDFDAGLLGQAGRGTDEQRRTGAMAGGSFGDDHADAGNAQTGDPYLDELRGGQVAGAEDWRRFSNADLQQWKRYYLGGGKFKNKYGDVVDKPIDSGPNTPQGVDGMGNPIAGGGGGGGGRGGGRGAGGGGGGGAAAGVGGGSGLEGQIEGVLSGLLSGQNSRYTPEVMQGILAKIKQQMEGSKARQRAEASSEAAGRGMSRAGATGARLDEISRGAESAFTGEYADLLQSKVDADYDDQMGGLDRAMKYVDSLKLELYRQDMTALQRQQLRAQIKLAEMNISAQRENLQATFGHNREMLGAQAGYDMLRGGV